MKRDKLDVLFSHFIKLLSGGYCARCGKYLGVKSRGLHCMHFFSRAKISIRFDGKNAEAGCYGCLRYLDNPNLRLEKIEFFLNRIGQKEMERLQYLADHPIKIDREAIEKDLKEKIKFLET